jgi:hypothetical protein
MYLGILGLHAWFAEHPKDPASPEAAVLAETEARHSTPTSCAAEFARAVADGTHPRSPVAPRGESGFAQYPFELLVD